MKCEEHAVFQTFMELCDTNLFHRERELTKINTLTSYGICRKTCGKNELKSRVWGIGFLNFKHRPNHWVPCTKPEERMRKITSWNDWWLFSQPIKFSYRTQIQYLLSSKRPNTGAFSGLLNPATSPWQSTLHYAIILPHKLKYTPRGIFTENGSD